MQINIEIKKRYLYLILSTIVLLTGVLIVIAYGGTQPQIVGHSLGEIDLKFETGRVENGETITPIAGYSKNECYLMVSVEDSHHDAKLYPYTDQFRDIGHWGDNHYAGSQAFYNSDWKVTCRYGFTPWDNKNPVWFEAKCRYLMICAK